MLDIEKMTIVTTIEKIVRTWENENKWKLLDINHLIFLGKLQSDNKYIYNTKEVQKFKIQKNDNLLIKTWFPNELQYLAYFLCTKNSIS